MDAIINIYGSKEGLVTRNGKIVKWPYDDPQPSQEELDQIISDYEADTEYLRLREEEYPSVGEQLDLIYHEGIDVWREEIKKIKDKYPKPIK